MSRPARARPVACAVLLLIIPGGAAASEPDPALAEARRLFHEAEALRRAGQPERALPRYQRAHALVPTPVILLGEAAAYHELGRDAEGLDVLRGVDPAVLPPDKRHSYQRLEEELQGAPGSRPHADAAHRQKRLPLLPQSWRLDSDLRFPAWDSATVAEAPPRRQPAWAKWLAGGTGLVLAATGATLWGISTTQPSAPGGMGALGVTGLSLTTGGLGLCSGAALMFLVEGKAAQPSQAAQVSGW